MQLQKFLIDDIELDYFKHAHCTKIKDCVLSDGQNAIIVALQCPVLMGGGQGREIVVPALLLWTRHVGYDIGNVTELPFICNVYAIPAGETFQDMYDTRKICISTIGMIYTNEADTIIF